MSSFTAHLLILLLGGLLLTHHCVQGQASKVSSKLDFDESDGSNNQNQTGSPGQPGQAGGTGNGSYDPGTGRSLSGGGGNAGGGSSGTSSGGNRPKIHGVRVTVDTGDGQQQTKESKESVEITDLGKHKKRVGIHTDITFEITSDSDGNETSSAQQQGDKEDASVPIFKGRGGSDSKHKTRKPYDPKSQWNPNFSGEQHGYQGAANRGGYQGSNRGDYYPQYYPGNVYAGGSSDAGSIYRNGETWTHYVPVWTTERVPQEQGQIYRRPSWKPCYCMSSTEFRRRRDSKARREQTDQHNKGVINSGVVQVVDGKLERPFS